MSSESSESEKLRELESKLEETAEEKENLEEYTQIVWDKVNRLFAVSFNNRLLEKAKKLRKEIEYLKKIEKESSERDIPAKEMDELEESIEEIDEKIDDIFYMTYVHDGNPSKAYKRLGITEEA